MSRCVSTITASSLASPWKTYTKPSTIIRRHYQKIRNEDIKTIQILISSPGPRPLRVCNSCSSRYSSSHSYVYKYVYILIIRRYPDSFSQIRTYQMDYPMVAPAINEEKNSELMFSILRKLIFCIP